MGRLFAAPSGSNGEERQQAIVRKPGTNRLVPPPPAAPASRPFAGWQAPATIQRHIGGGAASATQPTCCFAYRTCVPPYHRAASPRSGRAHWASYVADLLGSAGYARQPTRPSSKCARLHCFRGLRLQPSRRVKTLCLLPASPDDQPDWGRFVRGLSFAVICHHFFPSAALLQHEPVKARQEYRCLRDRCNLFTCCMRKDETLNLLGTQRGLCLPEACCMSRLSIGARA